MSCAKLILPKAYFPCLPFLYLYVTYRYLVIWGRNVDYWGKGREFARKNRDENAKMDDWS